MADKIDNNKYIEVNNNSKLEITKNDEEVEITVEEEKNVTVKKESVSDNKNPSPTTAFNLRSYLVQSKSTKTIIITAPESSFSKLLISFGRRLYTFMPLLVSFLNTLTKVYAMSSKLTSKTPGPPSYTYSDGILLTTCDYNSFYSSACTNKNSNTTQTMGFVCESYIESVTVNCNYTSNMAYKGFVALWSGLFGSYILFMFLITCQYSTWDLRFYISQQHYKMGVITTLWKYFFFGLTIASAGYSFWSISDQNQDYAATTNDAELILSTILFIIFNFAGIMRYCKISNSLLGLVDHPMSKFPEAIPINYVLEPSYKNLYGVITDGNDVFPILEKAIAKSFVENDREAISKYGDPEKIIGAFKTMEVL